MKKFKETIIKIAPFVKPYKLPFIGAILFVILAAIFTAISPTVEGFILTQLTKDSINISKGIEGASVNFSYILKVLIMLAFIYIASVLSTYAASFLLTNAIQNTMRDLRNSVQDKIKRLPVNYFDSNSYGDVLSRITNDIDTISNCLYDLFILSFIH